MEAAVRRDEAAAGDDEWMTTREIAALIKHQPNTVRRGLRAGRYPFRGEKLPNREWRVRRRDYERGFEPPPDDDQPEYPAVARAPAPVRPWDPPPERGGRMP
jgi:hypothetical protein